MSSAKMAAILSRPQCRLPAVAQRELAWDTIISEDAITWKCFPHYWPFVRGILTGGFLSQRAGAWCFLCCCFFKLLNKQSSYSDLRRHDVTWHHCNDLSLTGVLAIKMEDKLPVVVLIVTNKHDVDLMAAAQVIDRFLVTTHWSLGWVGGPGRTWRHNREGDC